MQKEKNNFDWKRFASAFYIVFVIDIAEQTRMNRSEKEENYDTEIEQEC